VVIPNGDDVINGIDSSFFRAAQGGVGPASEKEGSPRGVQPRRGVEALGCRSARWSRPAINPPVVTGIAPGIYRSILRAFAHVAYT